MSYPLAWAWRQARLRRILELQTSSRQSRRTDIRLRGRANFCECSIRFSHRCDSSRENVIWKAGSINIQGWEAEESLWSADKCLFTYGPPNTGREHFILIWSGCSFVLMVRMWGKVEFGANKNRVTARWSRLGWSSESSLNRVISDKSRNVGQTLPGVPKFL